MWGARRAQRAAVVAALLVVAGLIVWQQFGRLGQGPATPPGRPDDPPAGVPVFYVRDGGLPRTIVAYDWNGNRRGSLTFPVWVDVSKLRPAPNGSGFMLDPGFPGDYAAYFDRLGHTLLETDDPTFTAQTWATDDTNLCVLSRSGSEAAIVTRSPNGPDHPVAISGDDFSSDTVTFDACNVKTGYALLQVLADANTWQLVVVGMQQLGSSQSSESSAGRAVVSNDATLVVLGSNVYRSDDFTAPIGSIDSSLRALAFSGDDSLLLAIAGDSLVAIEWRTATTAWTYPLDGGTVARVLARPQGGDFAIAVSRQDAARTDIVIAHVNGKTTIVSSRDPISW